MTVRCGNIEKPQITFIMIIALFNTVFIICNHVHSITQYMLLFHSYPVQVTVPLKL